MLDSEEILIYRFAQNKENLEHILIWFDLLDIEKQRKIVFLINFYLQQSHPSQELIEKAIPLIPLKPTVTPIALLKSKGFSIALQKITSLPDNEMRKAFISLIMLFKISDTHRRSIWCKDGCNHEWHNL
ncbi:DUF5958 family protein [Flavobacterium amniphilum]|uniref:DUF5958 family protein n=1 Tax=Flavobacterium amniphilum TaxID=1834035 RepID=UPI002029CA2D|nr:DUF5958 family protein [Flavobacterium amniphilum]MCL9807629.1 DUF5958 family protein [Flavobacterium amniphilum]